MSDAEVAAARRADQVRALTEERAGLVRRGLTDRVKQVDAELARLQGAPPKKRRAASKETT
jgi:hypothetical protein